jgi:cytochrome c biogenesis protein CcmG, thiol:disulfide interchange protein DsbE
VEEFPLIQAKYLQESVKADGVVFLAVDVGESAETVTAFMQSNKYTVPVLLDTTMGTLLKYGVSGVPMTFFIGRDGVIKYIKRGMFISQNELQNDLNKIAS